VKNVKVIDYIISFLIFHLN